MITIPSSSGQVYVSITEGRLKKIKNAFKNNIVLDYPYPKKIIHWWVGGEGTLMENFIDLKNSLKPSLTVSDFD